MTDWAKEAGHDWAATSGACVQVCVRCLTQRTFANEEKLAEWSENVTKARTYVRRHPIVECDPAKEGGQHGRE
jgi:hypothetical protein